MADPNPDDERAEAAAAAEQVSAGTDRIAVPHDLVEERAAAGGHRPPEKALWIRIREMSVAEKVKLALRGNKDARAILIHDTNKVITRLVLQNPRISDEEILMLAQDRNTDEEILRLISESREWTRLYPIRIALVENARTPARKALALMATLSERDISRLARSKNVPSAIATQARRMLYRNENRH